MGWLVLAVVVGLSLFGFFGLIFMGWMSSADAKVQKNAEQILNETFDGSETAVYKVATSGTLRFERVLAGAEERGYRLHAQSEIAGLNTLVFKTDHPVARAPSAEHRAKATVNMPALVAAIVLLGGVVACNIVVYG